MTAPLDINPRIGDVVLKLLALDHRAADLDIILIVLDSSDPSDMQPSFVSSMTPEIMREVLIQIGEKIPDAGKPVVTGMTRAPDGSVQ